MFTYLLINIFAFLSTFIFSFEKRVKYFSKWKKYIISTTIVAIFMLFWDYTFTALGVWGFSKEYLTGIYIANLPIEEVMFFFAIPYSSLFIYEVVSYFLPNLNNEKYNKIILSSLIIVSVLTLTLYSDRLYTFINFTCLSFLLIVVLISKPRNLTKFFLSFIIIIIPFLIVNGILTHGIASISDNPIVWYNDLENIGFRISTIPIEDLFYGMFMLMGNYFIYEMFLNGKETN